MNKRQKEKYSKAVEYINGCPPFVVFKLPKRFYRKTMALYYKIYGHEANL